MCEKLKERESPVRNHAHLWSFSIEFLPNHSWEGHGWAQFRTRLSLSFNFSCKTFVWVKFERRERECLGMRLWNWYYNRTGLTINDYAYISLTISRSVSLLMTLAGGMGGVLGEILTDVALLKFGSRGAEGFCPFFFCWVAGDSLGGGSLGFVRLSGVSGGLS